MCATIGKKILKMLTSSVVLYERYREREVEWGSVKYLGKFIYKRSSNAKGIVKNFVKEGNLSEERVGRKEKEPSFTEIQILSFTRQMASVLGDKSDLCVTVVGDRPICSVWGGDKYHREHHSCQSQKTILIWYRFLMRWAMTGK